MQIFFTVEHKNGPVFLSRFWNGIPSAHMVLAWWSFLFLDYYFIFFPLNNVLTCLCLTWNFYSLTGFFKSCKRRKNNCFECLKFWLGTEWTQFGAEGLFVPFAVKIRFYTRSLFVCRFYLWSFILICCISVLVISLKPLSFRNFSFLVITVSFIKLD